MLEQTLRPEPRLAGDRFAACIDQSARPRTPIEVEIEADLHSPTSIASEITARDWSDKVSPFAPISPLQHVAGRHNLHHLAERRKWNPDLTCLRGLALG